MMKTGVLVVALNAISLFGCGSKATSADARAQIDGSVGAIDSAPIIDARLPIPDAIMFDARTASAQWIAVHNELKAVCTPCHGNNGGSGGHKMGQTDVLKAFADSQLNASRCPGKTKGACAGDRIADGSMPPGGLAPAERTRIAALVAAWVAVGQP